MTEIEFNVELEGIINTIKNYTNDHYVRGYITVLSSSITNNNTEKTLLVIERLIRWYDENYQLIMDSEFVYNKPAHIKTIDLLRKYHSLIKVK